MEERTCLGTCSPTPAPGEAAPQARSTSWPTVIFMGVAAMASAWGTPYLFSHFVLRFLNVGRVEYINSAAPFDAQ